MKGQFLFKGHKDMTPTKLHVLSCNAEKQWRKTTEVNCCEAFSSAFGKREKIGTNFYLKSFYFLRNVFTLITTPEQRWRVVTIFFYFNPRFFALIPQNCFSRLGVWGSRDKWWSQQGATRQHKNAPPPPQKFIFLEPFLVIYCFHSCHCERRYHSLDVERCPNSIKKPMSTKKTRKDPFFPLTLNSNLFFVCF